MQMGTFPWPLRAIWEPMRLSDSGFIDLREVHLINSVSFITSLVQVTI